MTGKEPGPRCSIVVRAYNEEKYIGRLIAGIAQQTIQDLEIVLVDSGSTDSTVATARAAAGKAGLDLQVVSIQPNEFTFGRSLNRGIAAACSELIVIASAHVYPVYPDWLERLLAPLAEPQVALAYGKQSGNQLTKFSERQVLAHWFPDRSQPRQSTPFCNNANAAIRRSLWQQRPYDESLSGLEDLEWARWVMQQGCAVAYVAEAEIVHVHQETPKGVYNRYRREAIAFKRIFPEEHFRLGDLLRLVTTNIASDLWHAARQGVLGQHFKSIFWFRWMQFYGTYMGYRHSGPLTWQLRQTFYYPQEIGRVPAAPTRSIAPIHYSDHPEHKP